MPHPLPAVLQGAGTGGIDWLTLSMLLFGGLAFFLFGMEYMSSSLRSAAGDRLKDVLRRLTRNRLAGLLSGFGVTTLTQSSSVTTVLLVGFVGAGLMQLNQTVAVIMGSNIGTTMTAQIIAFRISHYALLLIACGYLLSLIVRRRAVKLWFAALAGLGMIFYGMTLMSTAMEPLRGYPPFIDAMLSMEHPLAAFAVGLLFTALVQSSSATIALLIALGGQGLISLPAAIAIAFGAEVGTCLTALIAGLSSSTEARRVAVVHILFNTITVFITMPFIPLLARLAQHISPAPTWLPPLDAMAAVLPRQIANSLTIFNLGWALLLLPLTSGFADMARRLVREPKRQPDPLAPQFLGSEFLATPPAALEMVRRELGRLGEMVSGMLERVPPEVLQGSADSLRELHSRDREVDALHEAITAYLGRVSLATLGEEQSREFLTLMRCGNALWHISNLIGDQLVHLGRDRIMDGLEPGRGTADMIGFVHGEVAQACRLSLRALAEENMQAARDCRALKPRISAMLAQARLGEAARLREQSSEAMSAYSFEMGVLECLKRIYYYAARISKTLLKASGTDGNGGLDVDDD